jgi:hypothetical protein
MTDWDSYTEGWNKCADAIEKRERGVNLCPRAINKADCKSAAWCVLSGNCGCDHKFKLMLRTNSVYADLHTAFQAALKERDGMGAALQSMVSAQHAGPITDEMHKAWEHARSLLTPNTNVIGVSIKDAPP